MRRHAAVAVLVVILATTVGPSPASAGGTMLRPVQDRYEGGDRATLVAYTQWSGGEPLPAFDAYLRAARRDGPVRREPTDVPLGPLRLERTDHGGGYLAVRASITFRVPIELVPSRYEVMICHDECPGVAGTIFGGELWVGVDPAYPVDREWALDDPEIANLAPGAVLTGPGFDTTAAAVRALWATSGGGPPALAVVPKPGTDVPTNLPPAGPPSEAGPSVPAPAQPAGAATWPWAVLALAAAVVTARMVVLARRAFATVPPREPPNRSRRAQLDHLR